ncbi:hypothetical protein NCCP2716_30900 [Sporosarcina sp. NCCP-2716]|uniref:hypothetical protein n=1 Tax=Sporosarcina sp. NCCP-2716 TaxID=2943679 RepID=UPI00203EDEAA|nr:hypothetical protein [Sporosarcina sp. NCCP-2716]GKV70592.1 hypothetical protein NCCP2716_30900 [Sporosarcina sp. NCCP-2716]
MSKNELEIDQILDIFIGYVDNCTFESEIGNETLEEVCRRHSIEYTVSTHSTKVIEILKARFEETIKSEEQFQRNKLRDLEEHLAMKYLVDNMEIQPYYQVLQRMNDNLQNGILIINIENKAAWNQVVTIILDVIKLDNKKFDVETEIRRRHIRQFIVGQSAILLKERGYRISVTNKVIKTEDFGRIARDIESLVCSLGGANVADRLFVILNYSFNQRQKRYRVIRRKETLEKRKVNSQYPYGFLLQLSVKNYVRYNTTDNNLFEKRFKELLELSQAYVSIMDIQDYYMYSNMFFDLENIVYYLHNNLLYDHTIAFMQWNPDYMPSLLKGLLTQFFDDSSIAEKIPYSLNDFIKIMKKILDVTLPYEAKTIKRGDLYTYFPKMDTRVIDSVLKVISHNRKKINKDYRLPISVSDFSKKPLIQISKDEFVLLNPSLCAFAFFETITDSIRNVHANFNSELGYSLEEFIMNMMRSKGIECKTGFYGDNSECDIVIETEKRIVFMEVKMKPLTRKAIAGDGVNLFVDLSRSLIASQKQLGAHELQLLEHGQIVLRQERSLKKSRNKPQAIINHDNRIIDRVSVVFTEYGFMTDKQAAAAILETITIGSVHSEDPKREHELNDLRKTAQVIQNQFEEMIEYKGEELRNAYFDCAFFTLQQLLMIINDSNSTESFVENLTLTHYASMNTSDFYYEYDEWRRIKSLP